MALLSHTKSMWCRLLPVIFVTVGLLFVSSVAACSGTETITETRDFNIDDFMKSSFGVFHGEPVYIEIRFAADIADYIKEKVWHETQRIEPQRDGSIIFSAQVAGTEEIKFWILKWGAKARVLAPESLRDEIRLEAEAMLQNYENNLIK